MQAREVHTTSLLEIRNFLAEHDCAPAPWETPDGVIERLYMALREKRDDQRFWHGLKLLVERLDDLDFDRTAFYGAKPFRGKSLSDLVDSLREQLGDGAAAPAVVAAGQSGAFRRWIAGSVSIAALTTFVLLGAAIGCGDDADDDDSDTASSESKICAAAERARVFEPRQASVYCELVQIVNDADISSQDRQALLSCLPEVDASYRADLLRLFETLTDNEIAAYLADSSNICDLVDVDGDDDDDDNDTWSDDDYWGDDDDH